MDLDSNNITTKEIGMNIYSDFINELESIYNDSLNYKIIKTNCCNKKAYIYFSSNGIYFPNTKENFIQNIIVKDRYEWENNIAQDVEKHIFVRDVYKGWYLKGINKHINSLEKIVNFLAKETEGYQVTTIGTSSGGYIATYVGMQLNCQRVFCFNGQFNLETYLEDESILKDNPVLYETMNVPEIRVNYNLINLLYENNVPIYYMFSNKSEQDTLVYDSIKKFKSIKVIEMESDIHGIPMFLPSLRYLFSQDNESLNKLQEKYSKYKLALNLMGVKRFTITFLLFNIRRVFTKIKKMSAIK